MIQPCLRKAASIREQMDMGVNFLRATARQSSDLIRRRNDAGAVNLRDVRRAPGD